MVLGGALLATLACVSHRASAQVPLRYANEATTVQAISFRFSDHRTFETGRLRRQIATSAPGFLDRLRNTFAFLPGVQPRTFPFDPVALQKDVVRLRRFYKQNGFLNPQVDYPASRLDTTQNQIHVIFTIREGPFLTVRDLDVLDATGTAKVGTMLSEPVRAAWRTFRRENVRIRGRYTDLERSRLEGEVQSWFRNHGFAFADVQSSAEVDTSQNAVDVRFHVDPGPRTVVSEIQIDGNTSVTESVAQRELPFAVGSRFSATEVERGRQRLFSLNIFRVALSELPAQPRDSTVVVRYRVREATLRSLSGQIGYGTQSGFTLEGSWKHRNFYGNARTLTVDLTANTGYPEAPPAFIPDFMVRPPSQRLRRRFRAEVTLQQPYLFTDPLSGSIAPFIQERVNPDRALNPSRFLDLNERKYGVNTTLTYDFLPYRPLTLQHSFFQTRRFSAPRTQDPGQPEPGPPTGADLFNGSIFSLDGTFGDADDFISPTRGYILNPSLQVGGLLFESGVEFVRASTEVSGYLPLSEYVQLAGQLSAGALWPLQESRDNLTPPSSPTDQQDYRDRFSDYLFYAGGPSGVRGWASRLAGGKILQKSPVFQDRYRAIGGQFKVGASLEARFPLPTLGTNWRTAAFVDGAYLTPGALSLTPSTRAVERPNGRLISTEPTQLLVGSGVGLRYKTSFGFLRMDIAFKLTPDRLDLRSPSSVRTAVQEDDPLPPPRLIRRVRLHFGIGRSF
jgi:outer membrane protein insertion porin family